MNAAGSFHNSNGSCCLNAKYAIDQEGLKVSMKVLGIFMAEENRWLLEYCALVYRTIISYAPTWEMYLPTLGPFQTLAGVATLCLPSCRILSERLCIHRLQRDRGERPEGRIGLKAALACVR